MDKYDFRKIDREIERELRFDWNPRITDETPPPKTELICLGNVWIEIPNPEYDCKVIMD